MPHEQQFVLAYVQKGIRVVSDGISDGYPDEKSGETTAADAITGSADRSKLRFCRCLQILFAVQKEIWLYAGRIPEWKSSAPSRKCKVNPPYFSEAELKVENSL